MELKSKISYLIFVNFALLLFMCQTLSNIESTVLTIDQIGNDESSYVFEDLKRDFIEIDMYSLASDLFE